MNEVKPNSLLSSLLTYCEENEASDLHAKSGFAYGIRIDGELSRLNPENHPLPTEESLDALLSDGLGAETAELIRKKMELDLSICHGQQRYRANFSKQQGRQAFSFRHVPVQAARLSDLKLPDSLSEIIQTRRGLVLVTGATGQGKSTTVRALLQDLNRSKAKRLISIEDPIEFVFAEDQCQIEQREVGIDTPSFEAGIRNAMRQDPDVIFVGEIRDRQSIWAALQAAETGHLVITTLHADSVPQAFSRLREFYPSAEQNAISSLLARNTIAVCCQRLIHGTDGRRLPCLEIMRQDAGAQEAIRTNRLERLAGIIEAATEQGMHSFDQYLIELLADGQITQQEALYNAQSAHRLTLKLKGFESSAPILDATP